MCGIAGYAGPGHHEDRSDAVGSMLADLARRGPDDAGIEQWEEAAIGNCRLSIYDTSSAGRQPMVTADGRVGVVFNGAIYNFRQLGMELRTRGARFRSSTDTEVLLHGYVVWGIHDLVLKLRGMFAFAIWDSRIRTLYLVRDRLGIKPLVYAAARDRISFASTARALSRAGMVDDLDPGAVVDFLNFGYVADPGTIYAGASKLPPASVLTWSGGKTAVSQYWSPVEDRSARMSFPEAVDATEHLLLRAVEKRLDADVPVGAMLSGGIDSSLVCWAAKRLGADIPAYTASLPGDPLDEGGDARHIARVLRLRHEAIPFSPVAADLDDLRDAYSEPFACSSALAVLRVCRSARDSVKVLLTGDGGDEAFLGYPSFRSYWVTERLANKLPDALGRAWNNSRGTVLDGWLPGRAKHFLDYTTGGLGAVVRSLDLLPFYSRANLLGDRLAGAAAARRAIPWSPHSARHLLTEFSSCHRRIRFVGEFMTKVDAGGLHYGIEGRSPFLDHDLCDFAGSLPVNLLFNGGRLKAVLREIVSRRIDRRTALGAKRGFSIPAERWLITEWRPLAEEAFSDSLLEAEGWLPHGSLRRQFRSECEQGTGSRALWQLFVLERWLRKERIGREPRSRARQPRTQDKLAPASFAAFA